MLIPLDEVTKRSTVTILDPEHPSHLLLVSLGSGGVIARLLREVVTAARNRHHVRQASTQHMNARTCRHVDFCLAHFRVGTPRGERLTCRREGDVHDLPWTQVSRCRWSEFDTVRQVNLDSNPS